MILQGPTAEPYNSYGEAWRLAFLGLSAPRAAKLMALFKAVSDDSGTHEGSPVTTVGCYVATVEQWDALEPDFRKTGPFLCESGP